MRPVRLAPLALVVLLAACSSGVADAPHWTFAAPGSSGAAATATQGPSPSPAASQAGTPGAGMMGSGGMMAGRTPNPAMMNGGGMMGGAGTSGSAAPAASASPAGASTRIVVTLTDMLTIEPKSMTVPHGVPVTFVITNTGSVLHEFTIGDAAEQDAHDAEMRANGGMSMPKDEPNAVGVEPGQTKELTYTFDAAGTTLAGCHVVGHYQAGMRAEITIE